MNPFFFFFFIRSTYSIFVIYIYIYITMNYHLKKSISIPNPSYKSYRAKLTIIYAGPRGIFIFYKFETRYVSSRKYLFSIHVLFSFAQFLECNLLCTIIKLRKKLKKRRKRKKKKRKKNKYSFFSFFFLELCNLSIRA